MKKENLTISCFYNDYINFYELEDGKEMCLIEEDIYQREYLKRLFDKDDEFYEALINIFDDLGIEEMRIKKHKNNRFDVILTSEYLGEKYRLSKNLPTVTMNEIFIKAYQFCLNELIKQSNIEMVALIEGIGDLIDEMKEDNINEHTIYLQPQKEREDNFIWMALSLINDTDPEKTEPEKQMCKNYLELKNKYNFKDIIFDEEMCTVTFKF